MPHKVLDFVIFVLFLLIYSMARSYVKSAYSIIGIIVIAAFVSINFPIFLAKVLGWTFLANHIDRERHIEGKYGYNPAN